MKTIFVQMNKTLESSPYSKQVSSTSPVPSHSNTVRLQSSPSKPEIVSPAVSHFSFNRVQHHLLPASSSPIPHAYLHWPLGCMTVR
jgi:hypothetical protein